jgi:hypothetical protein
MALDTAAHILRPTSDRSSSPASTTDQSQAGSTLKSALASALSPSAVALACTLALLVAHVVVLLRVRLRGPTAMPLGLARARLEAERLGQRAGAAFRSAGMLGLPWVGSGDPQQVPGIKRPWWRILALHELTVVVNVSLAVALVADAAPAVAATITSATHGCGGTAAGCPSGWLSGASGLLRLGCAGAYLHGLRGHPR